MNTYCPQCEEEKESLEDICPDCGTDLVPLPDEENEPELDEFEEDEDDIEEKELDDNYDTEPQARE